MLEYGKQNGQVQFEVDLQFHSMDLNTTAGQNCVELMCFLTTNSSTVAAVLGERWGPEMLPGGRPPAVIGFQQKALQKILRMTRLQVKLTHRESYLSWLQWRYQSCLDQAWQKLPCQKKSLRKRSRVQKPRLLRLLRRADEPGFLRLIWSVDQPALLLKTIENPGKGHVRLLPGIKKPGFLPFLRGIEKQELPLLRGIEKPGLPRLLRGVEKGGLLHLRGIEEPGLLRLLLLLWGVAPRRSSKKRSSTQGTTE